jgi:hypothetical protein
LIKSKVPYRSEKVFADGSSYKGMFLQGVPDGKGRLDYKDGSFYEGSFSKGTSDGYGKLNLIDGTIYDG